MAGQHCGSKKEKWEVACVCRLYGLEQSLSKGPFPHALNRPISHAWSLGPHILVKLTLNGIFISVKQNLSYVWSLVSHTLVKLTLNDIYSFFPSIKENLSHV